MSTTRFTIDHLIPKSIGGSDELSNLALSCR
ncbi:HNH endonuclease [Nostoc sp. MS1]|nr:HNH endonuclease [Nostoc sp. MS1]